MAAPCRALAIPVTPQFLHALQAPSRCVVADLFLCERHGLHPRLWLLCSAGPQWVWSPSFYSTQ